MPQATLTRRMDVLFLAAAALLAMAVATHLALRPREGDEPQPPRPRPAGNSLPRVSIIVPARDEAHNLDRLLASLSKLDHPECEVLVVDGGSTDGSRDVVLRHAARDARIRLVDEPPLPDGWVGKSWACWTGRRHATGDWLLFTDADTDHAPDSLGRAQHEAILRGVGLLTGLTLQELRKLPERVVMPPVFSLIYAAAGGPGPTRISDPDLAIANGQYLLFDARAYDALGGHEAVRTSITEDLALARHAARRGVRAAFVDLTGLVRVRMYRGARDMFVGWRKNVATGATHTPPLAYALTVGTFLPGLFALPLAAGAVLGHGWGAAAASGLAWALMTWRTRLAQRGSEGAGWGAALLHPLGYAFFALVLAASFLDRATGRGPVWKGRRYAPEPSLRR